MRRAFLLPLLVAAACSPRSEFHPPVAPESTRVEARPATPTARGDLLRGAPAPSVQPDQVGLASWYGSALAGRKTASGERFDPERYTAAHRTLPLGTWVEVRRVDTGRAVRVRINDRGPNGDARRVIDVSRRAAEDLGFVRDGLARVELRVVGGP
jgi:rare lipoprotein A